MTLICIDPGHGGAQPGACNGARMEKDAALAISRLVRDGLEARGYRVLMTRDADMDVSLRERCRIANTAHADAFIAIHLNAAASKSACGVEVWRWHMATPGTIALAGRIQAELVRATGFKDRGVRSNATFATLRHTVMPSLVVECGFISNDAECEQLFSPSFQGLVADAIARGVADDLRLTGSAT